MVRPFDAVEIRQRQFGIDDFDIAGRIDLSGHMDDVVVFETAHHVRDGVDFANVREKLVAQALALRCPGDQSCDIHELHRGRQNLLRMHDGGELLQTRIRHRHHAHIGINGAKGIIFRRDLRARQRVEQCGLAHIR